jgi:hypothetical protein
LISVRVVEIGPECAKRRLPIRLRLSIATGVK